MYHGILVDASFKDLNFPKTYQIFNKRKSGSWTLYGIEINNTEVEKAIVNIQRHLKENEPFYAHLYDGKKLIVIFKNQIFQTTPDKSTWRKIIEYGKTLKIPHEQLDFWPNKFEEEERYFSRSD